MSMNLLTREELQIYVNSGNRVKYLFFWGHQKPKSGVSKTCFSQWYDSPFEHQGVKFKTAEHFMMYEKARLFSDMDMAKRIIASSNPGEAKKLGRMVKGFDNDTWDENRFQVVVQGNMLKFSQNPEMKEFLLSTGERVLVEASPVDRIWGIGMTADHSGAANPNLWKGLNLLGFVLMSVRSKLREKAVC